MRTPLELEQQLLAWFQPLSSCVVAYSGGVDSAVVAKAAHLAFGEKALAVTGTSFSLAADERQIACDVARQIGIRHEEIATEEFASPSYVQNAPDRCFHCKTELYTQLASRLKDWQADCVVNGANADDAGDYRPGMQAAKEFSVRSPLLECGFTKEEIRALAAHWQLPIWDKPASPCLSSRVAYGLEVTPERLARIEAAEKWLRQQGLRDCRVRVHPGEVARLEVPPASIPQLAEQLLRDELTAYFKRLGFKFVTLDLEGLRSGSLNSLLTLR
jgi:uncharacterized protein